MHVDDENGNADKNQPKSRDDRDTRHLTGSVAVVDHFS
jgi:hypothetical protein